MSKKTDVVVVGSGLAGLVAALAAGERGKRVTLLTFGAGALSIGSGCVDLLGYLNGKPVDGDPLDALNALPPSHPYRTVGVERVRAALDFFTDFCARQGSPLLPRLSRNRRLPTVMGTLKPTYLCPPSADADLLHDARRVLVAGVGGLKDCHPGLIIGQLRRYPTLADKEYRETVLPAPFGKTHRNITPLDVARYLDTEAGVAWLCDHLTPQLRDADVVLVPPICGTEDGVWHALRRHLGRPLLEMLSIPPGVSGLRLRRMLLRALHENNVEIVENVSVTRAEVEGDRCTALITSGFDHERSYPADAFIIATGGFMGGGFASEPGVAREAIFGLPLRLPDGSVPEDPTDWSAPDIFGSHPFAMMGVAVDDALRPVDDTGAPRLKNVHFAGRSLGGYDFSTEKSGNGVALVTGWHAAQHV